MTLVREDADVIAMEVIVENECHPVLVVIWVVDPVPRQSQYAFHRDDNVMCSSSCRERELCSAEG